MQLIQSAVVPYRDIVDGFVLSASQLYLPGNYRAAVLSQMDVIRRAAAYRTRHFVVPNKLQTVVPAYSQVEQQISMQAGSYVWGLTFTAPFDEIANASEQIHIQITDACSETAFFSDYVLGAQLEATPAAAGNFVTRNPVLLTQPRLVGDPGLLDVELYNKSAEDINCQLLILVAEPAVAPEIIEQYFAQKRIGALIG